MIEVGFDGDQLVSNGNDVLSCTLQAQPYSLSGHAQCEGLLGRDRGALTFSLDSLARILIYKQSTKSAVSISFLPPLPRVVQRQFWGVRLASFTGVCDRQLSKIWTICYAARRLFAG